MSLGLGIAIAGIWAGAGLAGFGAGGPAAIIVLCALLATCFVLAGRD